MIGAGGASGSGSAGMGGRAGAGMGGAGGSACNGSYTGTPSCDQCLGAQCCPQIQACLANQTCANLVACLQAQCANAPNVTTCAIQKCGAYLGGAQLAQAVQTCQQQNCAMQCP
jgi:hypothetical protein